MRFEWDARKNATNKRKHGVSFEEAESVFADDDAMLISDPDHSEDEERFILLGLSATLRVLVVFMMRKHYDFSNAKPNPYAKKLKRQVTIRLDQTTIDYFRSLADELSLPYQTLINMYLRDCATTRRKPAIAWKPTKELRRINQRR